MAAPCFIGVDLGTSGCRAVAIDADRRILAEARNPLPEPVRHGAAGVEQDPQLWWDAVVLVLRELASQLDGYNPSTLCVDGTSSTLVLCDPDGAPLGPALMYNDSRSNDEAALIANVAPPGSAARSANSSLAKLLHLQRQLHPKAGALALHQADWIIGRLTGRFGVSDWNNCLKLGHDPQWERWPRWIGRLDLEPVGLPKVVAPGTAVGRMKHSAAVATGLADHTLVLAGTTDSTAAVISTGAMTSGDAVTCLGSTLVLKIIGKEPVNAPKYGVYSHRFGRLWLIGGASNSGGAVLRQYFDDRRIRELTVELEPDRPTGLDYYPLPAPGERFPISDGTMQPRLRPRPTDDARFFQGLLEGIAEIEAAGYRRLEALGAPWPREVLSVGGGAANRGWTRIREGLLGVPVRPARHQEAAYGTAIIALSGGVPA